MDLKVFFFPKICNFNLGFSEMTSIKQAMAMAKGNDNGNG